MNRSPSLLLLPRMIESSADCDDGIVTNDKEETDDDDNNTTATTIDSITTATTVTVTTDPPTDNPSSTIAQVYNNYSKNDHGISSSSSVLPLSSSAMTTMG